MTTIRDRVLDALQKFPETRNDDRLLYLKVLEAMKLITPHYAEIRQLAYRRLDGYIIEVDNLSELPSFEAVRRRRQEIQNDEHKFIPTDPAVLAARRFYVFYNECPREILEEEMLPREILDAVCGKCRYYHTDSCNKVDGIVGVHA